MAKYCYLFGPVPSRRFGWSLGVDPVPMKTCSQNCVFCQLGSDAHTVVERREYVPYDSIVNELERWKTAGPTADVITLAGSGEPTLHSRFGDIIDYVQRETGKPCVLLTNGGLLYQSEVCRDAAKADIVKVTLSAWDEESYRAIHRPHESLTFARLLEGEKNLRALCRGQLWVEVFLVAGVNDHQEALEQIAAAVEQIAPDQIHINTAVRPPAESHVHPVSEQVLESAAQLMGPRASVAARFSRQKTVAGQLTPSELLATVARHPEAAAQLAAAFGVGEETVRQMADQLIAAGELVAVEREGIAFYKVREEQKDR